MLRGVNHPTIYEDRSGAAMPEIAKTGANAVRLFWFATHGIAITESEAAIKAAIANKMVPMLALWDSTGTWDLNPIVSYWTSPSAVALIKKYENNLIINLANEATAPNLSTFAADYTAAVKKMRSAGIRVPIVLDASDWGTDASGLLDSAVALQNTDPDHNLVFSAHLYDPYSETEYGNLFKRANSLKVPFIVGEFANQTPWACGTSNQLIDYDAMLRQAQSNDIGWLAWSWGNNDPNSAFNDCPQFDMTNTFAFSSLFGWGKSVAVDSAASISKTSIRPYSLQNGSCR